MTNLAICSKCSALTPDTDEDVAKHRRKAHTEPAADIERARSAASAAETALKLLRATVRDYEAALDERPVPIEPEITMRVVEDDEIEDYEPEGGTPDPYAQEQDRANAFAAFGTTTTDDRDGDFDDLRSVAP